MVHSPAPKLTSCIWQLSVAGRLAPDRTAKDAPPLSLAAKPILLTGGSLRNCRRGVDVLLRKLAADVPQLRCDPLIVGCPCGLARLVIFDKLACYLRDSRPAVSPAAAGCPTVCQVRTQVITVSLRAVGNLRT